MTIFSYDVVSTVQKTIIYLKAATRCVLSPLQLCQFVVSSAVRHGIQVLQVEDRTILVNNTPYEIQYRALLAAHTLGTDDQVTPAFSTSITLKARMQ